MAHARRQRQRDAGADEELLDAWQTLSRPGGARDDGAWRVVEQRTKRLARALRTTGEDQEEAASELLVSAFRLASVGRLPPLSTAAEVGAYLWMGLRNALVSFQRKQGRESVGEAPVEEGLDRDAGSGVFRDEPTPNAEALLVTESAESQAWMRAQSYWRRAVELADEAARAVAAERPQHYRAKAESVWKELRAVQIDGRSLDDVIAESDGRATAAPGSDGLRRARAQRYTAFKRLRQDVLEAASKLAARGAWTTLDLNIFQKFATLELKGAKSASGAESGRVHQGETSAP